MLPSLNRSTYASVRPAAEGDLLQPITHRSIRTIKIRAASIDGRTCRQRYMLHVEQAQAIASIARPVKNEPALLIAGGNAPLHPHPAQPGSRECHFFRRGSPDSLRSWPLFTPGLNPFRHDECESRRHVQTRLTKKSHHNLAQIPYSPELDCV